MLVPDFNGDGFKAESIIDQIFVYLLRQFIQDPKNLAPIVYILLEGHFTPD